MDFDNDNKINLPTYSRTSKFTNMSIVHIMSNSAYDMKKEAFNECKSLVTVHLPNQLQSITN